METNAKLYLISQSKKTHYIEIGTTCLQHLIKQNINIRCNGINDKIVRSVFQFMLSLLYLKVLTKTTRKCK